LGWTSTTHLNTKTTKKGFFNDNSNPLRRVSSEFVYYYNGFSSFFKTQTRSCHDKAEQYFKGLVQSNKKNMERMAEVVPDSDDQSLQHFLSNSKWDEELVINKVAHDANQLIGGKKDSCLLIDETGFPKKGTKSVGVARQWCGQLGKVDNCQVGVFAVLGNKNSHVPVDFRLYLTESWINDEQRCIAAGIPRDHIEFQSKHDLALQMVVMARIRGLEFNWVGFDGFYGENPSFLRYLDDLGEIFMADVHKDQRIYLEDPDPVIPEPKSQRGRKPTRLKAKTDAIRVDKWVKSQPDQAWKMISVRDTTKGKLLVKVLHKKVWLWDGEEQKAKCWHLIVRRDLNDNKTKYSLCNASEDTTAERLVYMQAQRFWVERSFQDSKMQCGMGDYQARGWLSWHHHMAMVLMAMLFMLEQRLFHKDTLPLISCTDIVAMLNFFLPNRAVTEEEVFRQLEERHRRRRLSIIFAYKKQICEESSSYLM
jgi:SRSO17 transposase